MPRKPKAIVLDSWSIIAYLEDEPSGQKIADLIADANEEEIPLCMSVVNAGEVWYIIAREISEEEANSSIKQLRELRIQLKDADWELTQEAARFKSQHKMSYADCYAGALAKTMKADLVTGDKEFKAIEDVVAIYWV
ncbi:MAG: type II toxin-antitoxin system VapC family toxin [Anaerolineaceae bacterium]|jgi:ribonuclease VapC